MVSEVPQMAFLRKIWLFKEDAVFSFCHPGNIRA
jgi:hypothetical protein